MLKENWPVTFSFGVATFLRAPKSVTEMLKTADELMYFAKFEDKEKAIYKVL
jgi:PleD family two-component response regulator